MNGDNIKVTKNVALPDLDIFLDFLVCESKEQTVYGGDWKTKKLMVIPKNSL